MPHADAWRVVRAGGGTGVSRHDLRADLASRADHRLGHDGRRCDAELRALPALDLQHRPHVADSHRFPSGARGRAIVDTYRDAAERYGFIVAGSNTSRNGPWDVSMRAASAMFQDIGQRFAVDGTRTYLTGHSGGSRVALQIALANKAIAGVIASSAGYPDVRPRASVSFPIFATAGVDDFNYIEMRTLGRALEDAASRRDLQGRPHAAATRCGDAGDRMARTAGDGVGPAHEGRHAGRSVLGERRSVPSPTPARPPTTVHLLRAMADDFRTLRDVKAIEARASALARRRTSSGRSIVSEPRTTRRRRSSTSSRRYQAGLTDDALRMQSLHSLKTTAGRSQCAGHCRGGVARARPRETRAPRGHDGRGGVRAGRRLFQAAAAISLASHRA